MSHSDKLENESLIDGELVLTGPKLEKKEIPEDERLNFSFYAYSYKLLAVKIDFLFDRFGSLQSVIYKSGMPIWYKAYISGIVLVSLVLGLVGVIAGVVLSLLVTLNPPILQFAMPVILGALFGQFGFGFMYIMPKFKLKARTALLLAELPYYVGYMATLASSGLNLQGVFRAISREDSNSELVKDAQRLIQDLDMLGMDLAAALKDLIKRSPSDQYTELLEGLVTTVSAGGDLKAYFASFAKIQLEEKKIMIKKTTAALGMLSELYTILLIVFPLLGSIILSVMGIMTPSLGGFDLTMLMTGLTFVLVPVLGAVMLFMMDAMVPKR